MFAEYVTDSGMTYGVSFVPVDVELGEGSRTDVAAVSENDAGTRTASAEVTDLITLYTNVPMGSNGWYALLGYMHTTVTTQETLKSSSYEDATINGYQIGLGQRAGNFKYELAYSDFENIKINATGGNTNSISADADALTLRMSYGF